MPIFGEPMLHADVGRLFEHEKKIIDGPDTNRLFSCLKNHETVSFLFEDIGFIGAELCLIQRNNPDSEGRYYNDWIIRCEYQGGKTFKAIYNSGTRKGNAGFEKSC